MKWENLEENLSITVTLLSVLARCGTEKLKMEGADSSNESPPRVPPVKKTKIVQKQMSLSTMWVKETEFNKKLEEVRMFPILNLFSK
jgi:hypothetical protein